MVIHQLPEEVSSQIAAGEVVERPASVVKELLENALDAGARQVDIQVEGAGKVLIQISDDGCGIAPDELELSVARHATSKLFTAEDLQHIRTLGFRGEALASIGSVARLTVTSLAVGRSEGARMRVSAGQIDSITPASASQGTVIRVENLFFSVPARLKFLKSDTTEKQQIDHLVSRYALAYPNVRFRLEQDSRVVLQTSGGGDRREVLAAIYGVEFARQMLEAVAEDGDFHLQGFISPIHVSRSNRREIIFFLNGRLIQDTSLTAAFIQAYQTMLMVGRYPLGFLFIQIPPEEVDVNVHPAKAEVRFRSPDRMFSSIQRSVRRALLAYTPIPRIEASRTWLPLTGPADPAPVQVETSPPMTTTPETSKPVFPGEPLPKLPMLRLVGQIGAAYLVAEGPDGLYLIDQHAAHERVLFERFRSHPQQDVPAQVLLKPEMVQLPPQTARLLTEQLPLLGRLGFQVDPFGADTFLIRAIPSMLLGSDPQVALRALVEDFEEDETPLQAEIMERLAARICKRAAVKAGQVLSPDEQKSLLRGLENCQSPRTCPHGRPTMIHLSVDLLERQFGRRGPR